jgi:hypothetical protein
LIYGDNPDANLLEKAVTWVIVVIVAVFDPLAIMMLLAATESLKWGREKRLAPQSTESNSEPEVEEQPPAEPEPEKSILEQHPYLTQGFAHFKDLQPMVHKPEPKIDPVPVEVAQSVEDEEEQPTVQDAIRRWKAENPNDTLKNQRKLYNQGQIDKLPWEEKTIHSETFGQEFPEDPLRGDTHVSTAKIPHQVYKFNGDRWIVVDKGQTDSYTFNTAYVNHLIEKIESGEYDPDLLSDSEREQVTQQLSGRT